MQAIHAADEIINSFEQGSNPDSSEAGTQPTTPEPGQAGNWGSCGQPTPDTSPESIVNVPSRRKKAPVCLDCQRDIGPVTTISSEIPSTEEIAGATSTGRCSQSLIHSKHYEKIVDGSDHCSHYSTDSEVSEEASTASCPEQEEISSLLASLRNSVISLFNLARQRNSRADARVQDTIRLTKSLPTIRRTRIKNPTRKLTPSQYKQLLEIIQDSEVFPDKLRFEYTHSTQQFEIRMVTRVHEGIVGELKRGNSSISSITEYGLSNDAQGEPTTGGVSSCCRSNKYCLPKIRFQNRGLPIGEREEGKQGSETFRAD